MQKITFIFYLFIFITGCSVIKKRSVSDNKISEVFQASNYLEEVEKQNITAQNIFIQRAEIEIVTGDRSQIFIANMKFVTPDKYLISLKSKAGIEAARIYITRDTVLVNDRINKKLYYGKPMNLSKKYGITYELLPIVLGDFIKGNDKSIEKVVCADDMADLDCSVSGMKISYKFDCKKMKVVAARQESGFNSDYAMIEFGTFIKAGNCLMPSMIKVNSNKSEIIVRIKKIESPWEGTIEFIPGSRYDLIEIL